MFAKDGYTPLAILWGEFRQKRQAWCRGRACMHFKLETSRNVCVHGSPIDLCEDLFLKTLQSFELALLTPSGDMYRSASKLTNSSASLFTKATVLESTDIANDPEEAGFGNEWLARMGSVRFVPWQRGQDDVALWCQMYCSDEPIQELVNVRTDLPFNTLPYFFERSTYTLPTQLPPWSADLIDDSVARNLPAYLLGATICLDRSKVTTWRRGLKELSLRSWFDQVLDIVDAPEQPDAFRKIGRPKKVPQIAEAYAELGLIDSDCTWKSKHTLVSQRVGFSFSSSSLKKAARMAKEKKDNGY